MSLYRATEMPPHPGRDPRIRAVRRDAALAAAAIAALAVTMAWVPAASASTGQVSRPAYASRVAGTTRSLLDAVRQRAVSLPSTVSVGNGPDGLAFDPATHTLYTSNQNDNTLSVINTATCNAAHTRGCRQRVNSVSLPAGASPQGIAIDTVTGTIYVANIGGNTVSVINARTCNATNFSGCRQTPASIKNPGGPIALALNQATDTIYVANIGDNFSGKSHTVSVINGATCNGRRHSGCGHTPRTVRVGAGPDGVAVNQATDTIYVVNNGPANNGDTVSVINGATCNGRRHSGCGQTAASVRVGHGPFWIAVNQATHTAYTANNTDSTVSVINTATCNARRHSGCGQRTSAVPVGFRPWALTIDRALHTVFVINNSGRHDVRYQLADLRRRAPVRLRPPAGYLPSREGPAGRDHRPGHRHRLRRELHRQQRLGDQPRPVQRRPHPRLPPPGSRRRGGCRPGRARRGQGHQHRLRRQ